MKKILQIFASLLSIFLLSVLAIDANAAQLTPDRSCDSGTYQQYGIGYIATAETEISGIEFFLYCSEANGEQFVQFDLYTGSAAQGKATTTTRYYDCQNTDVFSFFWDVSGLGITLSVGDLLVANSGSGSTGIFGCYNTTQIDLSDNTYWTSNNQVLYTYFNTGTTRESAHKIFGEQLAEETGAGICDISADDPTHSLETIKQVSYTYTGSSTEPDSVTISTYNVPFALFIFFSILCAML